MSESILVVRPGALGDTILVLPLLQSVREQHPGCQVTFLGSRAYLDLLPSDVTAEPIEAPRWLWLFEIDIAEIHRRGRVWDYAYLVLKSPEPLIHSLFKAGTKHIASVSSTPIEGTHLVESMHQGLELPLPPKIPALVHLAPRRPRRDVIWVHPGSGGPRKCAPLDLLTSYAEEASRKMGLPIVITVGEADAFLKKLQGWERLVGLASRMYEGRPLLEIVRKLGHAAHFIGNDSGMSHLAAGLGVPSTVFFISTDPVQWAPWVPEGQATMVDLRGQTYGPFSKTL
ncbi:MAG: glycosyltransferase family 9 protein [Desulfomonile sp.]|nr:glycosyltransferase family 9 protein [Desulfomonile sp.]